jgi:F-type H+-transporting ATPase subunit gamma
MAELRELQRKLDSIRSLREVVDAMRNLAAIYVRRAETALESARPYADVVETALNVVLSRVEPASGGTPGQDRHFVVVFSSDQGLCGTYNERVVRAALAFRERSSGPVDLAAIGGRGGALLSMRGVQPVLVRGAPTSLEGIRAQVLDLAGDVYDAYTGRGGTAMWFAYNAYEGMGRFQEDVRPVLPPRREKLAAAGKTPFRTEPLLTTPPLEALGRLIEEYFFIDLYRALLESHCSENGARLLSMTAASSNIDDRHGELTREFQSVRQDTITAEMLDVVGGAEALAGTPSG